MPDPFASTAYDARPVPAPPQAPAPTLPEAGMTTQELHAVVAPKGPPILVIVGGIVFVLALLLGAAIYLVFLS